MPNNFSSVFGLVQIFNYTIEYCQLRKCIVIDIYATKYIYDYQSQLYPLNIHIFFRIQMHKDGVHLIKDRRRFGCTYNSCFIGSEAISWVITNCLAIDRLNALQAFTVLQDNDIIHHGKCVALLITLLFTVLVHCVV